MVVFYCEWQEVRSVYFPNHKGRISPLEIGCLFIAGNVNSES